MNYLIGLHGLKRSGKDTVADYLRGECYSNDLPFKRLAFADEMRVLAMETLPEPFVGKVTYEDFKGEGTIDRDNDDLFKMFGIPEYQISAYLLQWINRFSDAITLKHGYLPTSPLPNTFHHIRTIRDIMVYFGTEIGRDTFFYDIWLEIVQRQYKGFDGMAVVTDVRFDNEAELIHNDNGRVIHIVKTDQQVDRSHRSEQGIDDKFIDDTIVNVHGDLTGLRADVASLYNKHVSSIFNEYVRGDR